MTKHEKLETGTQIALPTVGDPFQAYADSVAPQTIVGTLLKFSKGEFLAGKESTLVPLGTRFIANLDAVMAGWTKWVNDRPVDHALVRIADGLLPPKREQLGDTDEAQWQYNIRGEHRDPWQQVNYLPLIDADGEIYTLSITSIAGLREVGSLCSAYAHHRKTISVDEFPLIEVGVDSYQHRDRSIGRVKFPTLNIVGWEPKEKFTLVAEPTVSAPPDEDGPPPHTELPPERDDAEF